MTRLMDILLISVNNEREPYPVAPLGALCVAGAVRGEHAVRVLDLCFAQDDESVLAEELALYSPQLIGISLRNIDNLTWSKSIFYLPRIRRITEAVKRHAKAPIVIGGTGFSLFPEEVLRYLDLEYGIVGEGEESFPAFAAAVASGGSLDAVPNLCLLQNNRFRRPEVSYLQTIGGPDRSLVDMGPYFELGGMGNVQTKRGCPFRCSYCTYPEIEGRTIRLREPGDVAAEIEELIDSYKARHVFFVDDIFNFPEEHAAAVCEEIIRRQLNIEWTCFATPMGMTAELAGLMKRAGCAGVEFGSDAGAEKTLDGLCKQFTVDDIAHAAEACRSGGLPQAHYIILGGPGEDAATVESTCSLFDRIRPTAVIALPGVRIYPHTELHRTAIRDGVVTADRNLLEPVFYLSPEIPAEDLLLMVEKHARSQPNWIVPALNIRCDAAMMSALRSMGKTGPLWNML